MSNFLKTIKSKSQAQWEPAYINYVKISRLLEIFKIVSILYKYITHHDDQETQQIDQLSKDKSENLQIIGLKLQEIVLFQRRKADGFIRYKIYQLYLAWILIEQAICNLSNINFKQHEYIDKRKNIKQAVQTLYQNTNSLINFIELNKNIVEHLTLQINQYVKPFYNWENIQYTFFQDRNQLKPFAIFINQFYSQQFCSIYNKNQSDLLSTNQIKKSKPKQYFFMGLFIGFALLLLLLMILSFILDIFEPNNWSSSAQSFKYIFPMFRGIALFVLYIWGLSWNVWGFKNYGINYRLVLKMGSHYSTYIQVMKRAGFFTMLVLIMMILYLTGYQLSYFNQTTYIPIQYTPLVVYFIFFSYIFFPTRDMFNPKGREYFYNILRDVLFSPFLKVTFLIAFVTGQFLSFVQPLKDVAYTICYYASDFTIKQVKQCLAYNTVKGVLIGYVVAVIPITFRMIQCFNQARQSSGKFFGHLQMWNFFKNGASFTTSTLSFLNKFDSNMLTPYICSSIISTLASYYWDIKYSWGLLEKGAKYRFLRNTLSYKNPILYYVAIVANLILRCAWTLTISSFIVESIQSTLLVFITSLLEIFRRCMWNFFRVERQHLGNCKDFRTTQSIQSILSQQITKGSLVQQQDSDYQTRLDPSNSITVHHRLTTQSNETHNYTLRLIHNTTTQMVDNALQYFKRMVRKQQDFITLTNLQTISKLYSSIDKPNLILARYKLKQIFKNKY